MQLACGLLTVLVGATLACGGGGSEPAASAAASATPAPSASPSAPAPPALPAAPHGGALQVLGERVAHLELVVDTAAGRLHLHVLDARAASPVAVAHPTIRALVTVGDTSALLDLEPSDGMFSADAPLVRDATRIDVRVETVTVRGQTFDNVRLAWSNPAP